MRKQKKVKPTGKRKVKPARRNAKSTSVDLIIKQMNEPRPLPLGRSDFEAWSDRIIAGAVIRPNVASDEENREIFVQSQKFALANMLMHLGPTESHKPDAHFIHSLRKFAINQVADMVRKELHDAAKARTAAEEALKTGEQKSVEASGEATLHRIGASKSL